MWIRTPHVSVVGLGLVKREMRVRVRHVVVLELTHSGLINSEFQSLVQENSLFSQMNQVEV